MYTRTCSSFTHRSKKVEASQVSASAEVNNAWFAHAVEWDLAEKGIQL